VRSVILKEKLSNGLLGLVLCVALTVSACGGENYSATFESLLVHIENAEGRLEQGKDNYSTEENQFAKCIGDAGQYIWLCEDERSLLSGAYTNVQNSWNFASDTAEMQAIRLPSSNSELSLARDSFVNHLDAWTEYLTLKSVSLPSSMYASNARSQVLKWVEVVVGENEIGETFEKTCSGLGNAQPIDSDAFKARIVDICDD
jgi:hypothetical protein